MRNPPWIRVYNTLLEDPAFAGLPDTAKAHLVGIWLYASRSDNRVPKDATFIGGRINASTPVDLNLLLSSGFLEPYCDASNSLAECKQPASNLLAQNRIEQKRTEQKRKEETSASRDVKTGLQYSGVDREAAKRHAEENANADRIFAEMESTPEGAALLARFPVRLGGTASKNTPEELRAQAEAWLSGHSEVTGVGGQNPS